LAATATVALPDPVPPPLTVVHDPFPEDVHAQPDVVVTFTVALPAPEPKESDPGDTL
jgi:hypothetical protein